MTRVQKQTMTIEDLLKKKKKKKQTHMTHTREHDTNNQTLKTFFFSKLITQLENLWRINWQIDERTVNG